ncbi:MAG: hypothetical protein RL181_2811 [Bacteroidota bacterium]|jgi:rod shape-determining protein MreD
MNSNPILVHTLRFVFLALLQILVLKQIPFGPIGSFYAEPMVYPLFLMLLPVQTSREILLLIGFALGLTMDMFYDSWGVHASASVFLAFVRPSILRSIEPKGGYVVAHGLTLQRYKIVWFLRYTSLSFAFFLIFYFSMQVFTPVYLLQILVKTVLGFIASLFFVFLVTLIFNPLD